MPNTLYDIISDDCWCCIFEFLTQSELFTIREVSTSFRKHATHVISNLTQVGIVDSYQFRDEGSKLNESAIFSFLQHFPNISRLIVRGFLDRHHTLFSCVGKIPTALRIQELVYLGENSSFVGPDSVTTDVFLAHTFPSLKKATVGFYSYYTLRIKADTMLQRFDLIEDWGTKPLIFFEVAVSETMNKFPVLRSSVEYLTGYQTKAILELHFGNELNNIANGEINSDERFMDKYIDFWRLIGFHPSTKFNIKIDHAMVGRFSHTKRQTLSRYLLQAAMCFMLGADAKGYVATYNRPFDHEAVRYALRAVDILHLTGHSEDFTDLGYEADAIAYSVAIMHSNRNQKKVLFSWHDYLQSHYERPSKKKRL